MPRSSLFLTSALVAALGAATYAGYRAQAQRAATLARLTALDACLAARNEQRAKEAVGMVIGIADDVHKNHNVRIDVAVLQQARQIQARTQSLVDTLHLLRQQWRQAGSQALVGWVAPHLSSYHQLMQQYVPNTASLTQASAQNQATGWLGQFDLTAEPLPAALAVLTRTETQVRQTEAIALQSEARKIIFCGVYDKTGVFAAPTSATVAPGVLYQAQVVLASVAWVRPRLWAEGSELTIDPRTNHGLVSFRIPAARPHQPDTVRATWHGAIRLQRGSADTLLNVEVPYSIVKRPTP